MIKEIEIYKTLVQKSNQEEAEKLLATKLTEVREDYLHPLLDREMFAKYNSDYISKARSQYLTAAYRRGTITSEVLNKNGKKWIDKVYDEWFDQVEELQEHQYVQEEGLEAEWVEPETEIDTKFKEYYENKAERDIQ